MKISEILSNPVRMRILQYLQAEGTATTKQMSDAMPDIPAPTLYRHVNRLLEEDVLTVREERKVRGTTERLLGTNPDLWKSEASDISGAAYQFLMALYSGFREYGSREDADPAADMLCLRTCVLRLTDESFERFLKEYAELLEWYMAPEEGGKLRSVSIISAPVAEVNEQ